MLVQENILVPFSFPMSRLRDTLAFPVSTSLTEFDMMIRRALDVDQQRPISVPPGPTTSSPLCQGNTILDLIIALSSHSFDIEVLGLSAVWIPSNENQNRYSVPYQWRGHKSVP